MSARRRPAAAAAATPLQSGTAPAPLGAQVRLSLQHYFEQLDGQYPSNLYRMVLGEVEPALLRTVLHYTQGNQTRAAEVLGIDRSTLRKKLRLYGLD